ATRSARELPLGDGEDAHAASEDLAGLAPDGVVASEDVARAAVAISGGLVVDHRFAGVQQTTQLREQLRRDLQPDVVDAVAEMPLARHAVAADERLVDAHEAELAVEDAEADGRGRQDRL